MALWQARFFTGTVEQRKAGATSNGFDISKNGFIIYSPASMYMNPHSCQETWIQHRKAQEIGEHDLSGFTAWISKKLISNHESSHMLLLLLVPIPKEHGIKKRTRSIRKHCLTEHWGMGGRHSSYVTSTPQPAIIIYYIIY